jgi:hypothetical protein
MRSLRAFKHLNRSVEIYSCLKKFENPVPIALAYVGLANISHPRQRVIKTGVKLELRDFHDLVTAWIIFLRREYKPQPSATILLDIGANIGCFKLGRSFGPSLFRIADRAN